MRIRLRLSILTKLTATSLILLGFLAGIGYTGYRVIDRMKTAFAENRRQALQAEAAVAVETQTYRQATALRGFLLLGGSIYESELVTASKAADEAINQILATVDSEQTRSEAQGIKALQQDYQQTAQQVLEAKKAGRDNEALNALVNLVAPANSKIIAASEALRERLDKNATDGYNGSMSMANTQQRWMLWGAIAAFLVGLGLTTISTLRLTLPIRRLAGVANRVSEGDLTAEPLAVMDNDEVGDLTTAFTTMVDHLRTLIGQVHHSSQEVAGAAEQLKGSTAQVTSAASGVTGAIGSVAEGAGAQSRAVQVALSNLSELRAAVAQIASGAQDQSSRAQETASLVARMASAIERASAAIESVTASAGRAMTAARSGRTVVNEAVSGMERIRETVASSAERVRELGEVSSQIGVITGTITEIADQTNLLALNAAIEAARAGEHGRGFAVVADEVRKLAERASRSAGEIARLIAGVQSGTLEAVAGMDRISQEVESGTELTRNTGKALAEIETAVADTEREVKTITAVTTEFATYSRQVNEAVSAVAAVTEENTAATEQMAAGADQVQWVMSGVAEVSEQNAAATQEVSAAMEELNASSEEIAASAENLTRVADELQRHLAQFKL